MPNNPPPDIFSVMLKADNGGSATILCQKILPDPLFPDKVVLVGVIGLSWPVAERWMHVKQWSVHKSSVLNWMVGPIRFQPDLDYDGLLNREKILPTPPGSSPNELVLSHPEELDEFAREEPSES